MAEERVLRVLHADDDDSFQLLTRRAIKAQGLEARCSIHFVRDGSDAVDYVLGRNAYEDRQQYPLPHLILLDQRMLSMDGVDAMARIKRDPQGRMIPTILFSTAANESLVASCYEHGGAFCIEKPMDFSRLGPVLGLIIQFATEVLRLPEQH